MTWLFYYIAYLWNRLFNGAAIPPVPWWRVTTKNILDYLVTNENGVYLSTTGVVQTRRHDWPAPIGYQASDSVLLEDGRILQTFHFTPFKEFNADLGDGGQLVEIGKDGYVRFLATQDGGTRGMQFFTGQGKGGTGWIVCGTDVVYGAWKEVIALLSLEDHFNKVPSKYGRAYTRYRMEDVEYKWKMVDGTIRYSTLSTIISEHYDGETIFASTALERSYFALGIGLIRWEAWGNSPPNVPIQYRYFPVKFSPAIGFNECPYPGWVLRDIRTWTNFVKEDEPIQIPRMWGV